MKFNDEQCTKLKKLVRVLKKKANNSYKETDDRFYLGLEYAYENINDILKAITYLQNNPSRLDTDMFLNQRIYSESVNDGD